MQNSAEKMPGLNWPWSMTELINSCSRIFSLQPLLSQVWRRKYHMGVPVQAHGRLWKAPISIRQALSLFFPISIPYCVEAQGFISNLPSFLSSFLVSLFFSPLYHHKRGINFTQVCNPGKVGHDLFMVSLFYSKFSLLLKVSRPR